jgi:hypothetical protein
MRHLAEPGLDIRIALGRVRDEVLALTGGQQEPFIYGSLGGATIALVPPPASKIAAPPETVGIASKPPPPAVPSALAPQPVATLPTPAAALPETVGIASKPPPALTALAPQPVATSPTPAPQTSDTVSCSRDEQRLAQLRAEPARDQIVKFEKDLVCTRLRAQVARLLESVGPTGPASQAAVSDAPGQQPTEVRAAPTEDACLRDAARLQRLRAEPNLDELRKLEHELTCEQMRPQLRRLRDSVGP